MYPLMEITISKPYLHSFVLAEIHSQFMDEITRGMQMAILLAPILEHLFLCILFNYCTDLFIFLFLVAI